MIADSVLNLVGRTPMVSLSRIASGQANIVAKCEFFNPAGSVKDRTGSYMIEQACRRGDINQDTVVIEPTSGNTGIALAWICAVKKIKLILTMPVSMSQERKDMLKSFGAELYLTPAHLGMVGAIEKAQELCEQYPNHFMPQQFSNPDNPEVHRLTTAEEIWKDTEGRVDCFVTGVGTGGTLTGVSQVLKSRKPSVYTVAIEPESSAVIQGGESGPHSIQGIGAGFVPDNFDVDSVDEVLSVSSEEAMEMTVQLARQEGLFCGISSGANVVGALKIAQRPEFANKMIVTVLCDLGDRYFSMGVFRD